MDTLLRDVENMFVILELNEATDVTNDLSSTWDSKRIAQLFGVTRHIESRDVDADRQHGPSRIIAPCRKQRGACHIADNDSSCRICCNQPACGGEVDLTAKPGPSLWIAGMAVRDPHRYAVQAREQQNIAAVMMNVRMHAIIGSVLLQNFREVARILPRPIRVQARKDLGAQASNLIVIGAWAFGVYHEVHLVARAVDVAQQLNQPRLDAPTVELA